MKSLPRFSVENPVLVNVLMMTLLVGGVYSAFTLVREMFPESRPSQLVITTLYPGATPVEVEKGIAVKIEEAIKNIEDIDKIESRISEGLSSVLVTLESGAKDIDLAVNDFKAAVDAIPRDELPDDAEQTTVTKFEPKLPVISVSVSGDVDEHVLKEAGRKLRDDLLLLPGISEVVLSGARKAELAVEVVPEKLIEYRLSLSAVAEAIRASNLDLPGGQLKTAEQNVAVRTLGETDEAEAIADTIVRTTTEGQTVRVRDLGRVIDDFEDSDVRGRFNGTPAVDIIVYKTADQDAIEIANKVKAYVHGRRDEPLSLDRMERLKTRLGWSSELEHIYRQARMDAPIAGVRLALHTDLSRFIEGRLDLLKRNAGTGLIGVFLALLVFMNFRVSFWVMMGLILAVCGALLLMNILGATLNLISMFGLIVALGMLVDDGIVVSENIYARVERGEDPHLAAIRGTEEVAWPVVVAVLTTIGAFIPLLFIEGQIGDFMGVLPVVVICGLAVSLVEALIILPSHLAEWLKPLRGQTEEAAPPRHWLARLTVPLRQFESHIIRDVLGRPYERALRAAVEYRYVTITGAIAALIVSVGFVASGRLPFVFAQKMDSEMLTVGLEMPVGTPVDQTEAVLKKVEDAANRIPEINSIYTLVGFRMQIGEGGATGTRRAHSGQSIIELKTVEERDRNSEEIIAELRRETADIAGVNSLTFKPMEGGPGGAEIEIELASEHVDDLVAAAERIKQELTRYDGVFDITDDFEAGRREVQIALLETARPLNLTTRILATEVRGAFYGLEARTLQRDREDVDIRVRFPLERRTHVAEIESMWIATPEGRMVPFHEVARLEDGRGYASIRRVDQRRAVVVSADVDQARGNAEQIIASLEPMLRKLEGGYAGLRIGFSGNQLETAKSFRSLKRDFAIALMLIFVMLAGLFKSYIQPLIVMTAIPFGLNGAVFGHLVMGYPLTILSIIGLVALTGIAVNDAIVMVDFINKERLADRANLLVDSPSSHAAIEGGSKDRANLLVDSPSFHAVIEGGKRRLRPIILTSLTTILGLAPLMAEQSFQARFLIPLAISITFGLMFSTVLTLLVVPGIYMIVEDVRVGTSRLWYGRRPDAPGTVPGQLAALDQKST